MIYQEILFDTEINRYLKIFFYFYNKLLSKKKKLEKNFKRTNLKK